MKVKSIQNILYLLIISTIIFSSCAKIVTPTGGPKDEDHPLIVEITPPDKTVNFRSKKVTITFDEYIQLKDLNNNLVISPPLEEKPEIKVKGKSLVIEFLEDLQDSTTYNIYFGNSVQDFNEGNPIENFQYVLSTGLFIDSMTISGTVLNSFNLLPEEGVFVMLYKDLEDSIPIKKIPSHISKTDETGFFRINNIGNKKFKLFCLRDFNKNYLFDLPNEDIAYIDSLIEFELITEMHSDTIFVHDSIYYLEEEEIPEIKPIDTIITHIENYYPAHELVLRLFTEYHEVQYLTYNARNSKQKIEVALNKPIKDSIIFSLVDTSLQHEWYIKEENQKSDSIIFWLTDSSLYNRERLFFAFSYQKEDSNMVYQWGTDTLNLRYVEPKLSKNEESDTSLKYNLNIKSKGTMDLNRNLEFRFETPLDLYDTSKINLFALVDSVEIPVDFELNKDSLKHRSYSMKVDWGEDTVYRLEIYPKAFTDIYETVNDTNILLFDTQKHDFYGKILIDVNGVDSIPTYQLICQLIIQNKDSETVVKEQIIQNNQLVEFDFLPPKEFMFKVILDKNFNGKWDTGEYLKHIQPEEVLYHDEKIKVRSNWDIEVNFNVNK
ncbi:MAG: hypothetical protein C0597_15950 [Marinilabiliales bacterium]|nr:MAG: hypothetical protein C0597_15950 [Marinilabiliales bacterium]